MDVSTHSSSRLHVVRTAVQVEGPSPENLLIIPPVVVVLLPYVHAVLYAVLVQ